MSTITIEAPQTVTLHRAPGAPAGWNDYLLQYGYDGFHLREEWASIFESSLQHKPHFLWATAGGRIVGVLPLMHVSGPIFGQYLVSMPYTSTGGVLADSDEIANRLVDEAAELADQLNVKHLELRHERFLEHPRLNSAVAEKVHMRLQLPATADELWDSLKSKVRSQIRKPRNDADLTHQFGGLNLIDTFYDIFCRNMRDLGTPPFAKSLFVGILEEFLEEAEFCVVNYQGTPVASGLLIHGPGTTLIPSASALREYNRTSCNMLMYWHVLSRAIERGQSVFDFGRSSVDAGTHKFKKQWGSEEHPAVWQYYSRIGDVSDARPNSGKYDAMISAWQKLPVWVTKLIGPSIVRGVP